MSMTYRRKYIEKSKFKMYNLLDIKGSASNGPIQLAAILIY